jgi:valyl-tRNA synthetase
MNKPDPGNQPIPLLQEVVIPGNKVAPFNPPATSPTAPETITLPADELERFGQRLTEELRAAFREEIERATTQLTTHIVEALKEQRATTPEGPPAAISTVSSSTTMEKTYHPHPIEQRWYSLWEECGYFAPRTAGLPYCIMLPPPNVTGSLHMGHAFQDTLMDCLIRYHRMRGDNVLWQCGTDHAGIATQMVVERQLAEQGSTRASLGRERFVEAVWRWKEHSGGTITRQLRRLGTSMDWSRERFTLDPELSQAVIEVFVRLYEEGLIYRGQRLVNWDPVLHTAISDLEVVSAEENGHLWHIRYPLVHAEGYVVVATTRPETMLGDVAVAVHPDDERYRALIGQHVHLPLTGRTIPLIADPYVDPQFGTGCVKITPAHDFNDYAVGRRHRLPLLNILTADACINDNGPPAYAGLDRFEARKRIVADLEAQGLLERVEPHTLKVPRGDRSHAVIEPYLTDQWYVKVGPLAEGAIRAVEEGAIRFVPSTWSKTYFEWMRTIEDWCISRQLWWGHRIPAWYDNAGTIYVGRSEDEVRSQYKLSKEISLTQDPDVLDTWFSSALWPFSTLGWPQETRELKTFYPTSVLVTGFDIIFFWVARMIMMGLKFTGQAPFREVYIHGLIRDADGQKMSKSKGNILDPLDLIDGIDLESLVAKRTTGLMQPEAAPRIAKATRKDFPHGIPSFGADALRFTFAALATQGRDIRFDLGRIEGYRNFCNKLWNAARYVLMSTEGLPATADAPVEWGLPERWIRSRLQQTITRVTEAIGSYRFDLGAQAIYEFTWDEYCDWYLELSKTLLNGPSSEAAKRGTRQVLVGVLETLLRLIHPFMPFITEELWQRVAPRAGVHGDSIMLQAYPVPQESLIDQAALDEVAWVKAFILGVRRIRAERNMPPNRSLPVQVKHGTPMEHTWLDRNLPYLLNLGRIKSLDRAEEETSQAMATAVVGEMTVLVPLAELIDQEAERKRLATELNKLREDHARSRAKLANPNYLERAPAEVVAREQQRCQELEAAIARLVEQ